LSAGLSWWARQTPAPAGNGPHAENGDTARKRDEVKPKEPWQRRPPEELARLPSPLDGRKRGEISPYLLALAGGGDPAQAPAELVAVLAPHRFTLPGEALPSWPAISPDGKLLAVPCGHTVVLFDAATGKELRHLTGPEARVFTVAFSPDGKRLAGGDWAPEGKLTVWDVQTGESVTRGGHTEILNKVAFSPDGKYLATASGDGAVRVWDAGKYEEVATFKGHIGPVYTVAFHPDGKHLVSAGEDRKVRVWDAGTGKETQTLDGHTQ